MMANHAWIIFIVVTSLNGFILKYRSGKYVAENPALKDGYEKYFRGVLFYGNIPWIIMGVGNLGGLTTSMYDYFDPNGMKPIVLVWHASILALWLLSIYWIYFKDGAKFIEEHPGLFTATSAEYPSATAQQVKTFFPLMLAGGAIAMLMMWFIGPS